MSVELIEHDTFAFPYGDGSGIKSNGLTVREYFAAQAMKGLLAGDTHALKRADQTVGEAACDFADDLIEALNNPHRP